MGWVDFDTMMEYMDMFAKNPMYDSASRTFMNMSIHARSSIGTDKTAQTTLQNHTNNI